MKNEEYEEYEEYEEEDEEEKEGINMENDYSIINDEYIEKYSKMIV